MSLFGSLLTVAALQTGAPAPDFSVVDIDGQTLRLANLLERGPLVLAFFPKAFTPG